MLKLIFIVAPFSLKNSSSPLICFVSPVINSKPTEFNFLRLKFSGKPFPLSLNEREYLLFCMCFKEIAIVPLSVFLKACLYALFINSLIIKPKGTA